MAKPTEQVRAQVTESMGLGGDAADDYGVPAGIDPTEDVLVAAGIFFGAPSNTQPSDGTVGVYIDPADGKLYFEDIDNLGPAQRRSLADLVAGTGGLTAGTHRNLDQLVHHIAETSYLEVTRASGKVTDIVYWTDNGKTVKIRETNITRSAGKVSIVVQKQYDGTGTLVETLTKTITRSGGKVESIDLVLT